MRFLIGRSREGAWIEIVAVESNKVGDCGRSREGAWIEIPTLERLWPYGYVAPVRERGLKCNHAVPRLKNLKSLP